MNPTGSCGSSPRLPRANRRVRSPELASGHLDGEEPFDAGFVGVPASLPVGDLGDQGTHVRDAPVKALLYHHPDLDLDHVEPAGVLRRVVELDPPEDAAGLVRRKGFVERRRRVGRQVVEDHRMSFAFG